MAEKSTDVILAEIQVDIKYIKAFINDADNKYANKLSEQLVYGLVGMVLIGVATALIAGVVQAADYIISKI